jgi:hypothetical protein
MFVCEPSHKKFMEMLLLTSLKNKYLHFVVMTLFAISIQDKEKMSFAINCMQDVDTAQLCGC